MRLEDMIREVHIDLEKSKKELDGCKGERELLEKELASRSDQVRVNLQDTAGKVEVLLKDNLAVQKTESVKLQNEIGKLKQDKVAL